MDFRTRHKECKRRKKELVFVPSIGLLMGEHLDVFVCECLRVHASVSERVSVRLYTFDDDGCYGGL